MEIQLKLRGNSEGFILESKLPDDEHWTERIEIVQEEAGYRLYATDLEILVLKESEFISPKKRIVARGLNKDLIYSEEEIFGLTIDVSASAGVGVSARAKVGVTTEKAEAKMKLGPFGLGLSIGW